MSSRNWRVMRNLLRNKSKPFVLPHTFKGLAQQRVKWLVAGTGVVGSITADAKRHHPLNTLQRGFTLDSFLKELSVFELLADSLQR